jgi:hypothetical protein
MNIRLPGLHTNLPMVTVNVGAAPELRLFDRPLPGQAAAEPTRRRIWELSGSFHCSIIGTCLTTSELRQNLLKMQMLGTPKESDHELHGRAVLLAGRKDHASKLLQKALDRRHRAVISQFSKARNAAELHLQWVAAVQRAEIPGAYWAVLTHPKATEDLIRQVFGEVHMLSHLVGAANRADIRRLRELEIENAALQEKVARQQKQLRDAVVSRDATIADLNEVLGRSIASAQQHRNASATVANDLEHETTARLVHDLRRRLAAETAGRKKMERRLHTLTTEYETEKKQCRALEQRGRELQEEIEATEHSLAKELPVPATQSQSSLDLAGTTLLYVGGRTHQLPQLRMLAEQRGATLLHHDGGIDDRSGLLASQVARADLVLFPVDCVSHNAVAIVKRISRQIGKPYLALRSSGLTSFVVALRRTASSGSGHRGL